jgi:HD-like signal output (HDOD) protein
MPETQPTPDLACDEARIDWAILNLLIDTDQQRPRAIEELIREHGNQRDALDGVDRLHSAGLVHRIGEFVFATRAAIRYSQIGG